VEEIKMNEQCGNVIENKGSLFHSSRRSGNAVENKGGYPQNAGMLLKTKGVIGNAELHATSKWPSTLPASHGERSLLMPA
jgi:hypothetical protein